MFNNWGNFNPLDAFKPLDITGQWSYNTSEDAAKFYNEDDKEKFSQNHELRLAKNGNGDDYLDSQGHRVHIFVGKNLLSSIGYFFRKLGNNWTEVELTKDEFGKKTKLKVLIDNADLMESDELVGSRLTYSKERIRSIFAHALQPKIPEIKVPQKDDFVRQIEESNHAQKKQTWVNAVSSKWYFSRDIKTQFQRVLESAFDSKDEDKKTRFVEKINTFHSWYINNRFIRMENRNCLSDAFHKEMATKLAEVEREIIKLPAGFQEVEKSILEDFAVQVSEDFIGRFRELPKESQTNV